MFNKKKIKELEDRLEKIEKSVWGMRIDDSSKYMISFEDAVEVEIRIEEEYCFPYSFGKHIKEVTSTIYFKKGTEPKCDYIKQDIDGKRTYYKNDVEVKIK